MFLCSDEHLHHYNTVVALIIRVVSIITIYDQHNLTPVCNAIRETK